MKKTIFITGSTDGIGKLTAIELASHRHNVYIHGRSSEKLKTTIEEIQKHSWNNHVEWFLADLSDLHSITNMVKEIKAKNIKIDVLINNAWVFHSPTPTNKDWLDMRIVVNYLAPYVLTKQLLEFNTFERIINLGSAAQTSINIDTLKWDTSESEDSTYAQSKLAIIMWSFYLSKELKDISVVAVNPWSLLNTKMVQEAFWKSWSPATKGMNILWKLTISEDTGWITWKYFDNDLWDFGKAHQDAYDNKKIEELITETEKILQEYQ